MEVVYTLMVFSLSIIVINLCNLFLKYKKHKRRKGEYLEILKNSQVNIQLINRSNNYINVYFVFKTMGKVSDIFSVAYSIATLALTNYSDLKGISESISILAVLFVVISIYVNPSKCAKEYLDAWRKSDSEILKYIEQKQSKDNENENENEGLLCVSKLITELEKSITTDGE